MLMIIFIILSQPDSRPSKFDEISFNTTESAELYFKNVRSFYYNLDAEGEGTLNAYRLSALYEDTLTLGVRFIIYDHWRQNLAFIRVDTNYYNLSQTPYLLSASAKGNLDSISIPNQYNESQYMFARDIFFAARQRNRIGFPNKTDTLWLAESDLANIKKTLRDYFKLVGKI